MVLEIFEDYILFGEEKIEKGSLTMEKMSTICLQADEIILIENGVKKTYSKETVRKEEVNKIVDKLAAFSDLYATL